MVNSKEVSRVCASFTVLKLPWWAPPSLPLFPGILSCGYWGEGRCVAWEREEGRKREPKKFSRFMSVRNINMISMRRVLINSEGG